MALDGYYAEGQALLDDWDFGHEPDSAAAAYFNAVYARMLALAFRDELPEEYWPTGRGRWFVVLDDLLRLAGRPLVGRRQHRTTWWRPATPCSARR